MHAFVSHIVVLATALSSAGSAPTQEAVHMRMVGAGKKCWVLLHAFGASGGFWQKRALKLADSHHVRVYYPDLPSHGLSAPTPTFNYTMATDAVQSALKHLCPKPEVIIGGSSGGIIAMKLGARTHAKHVVGVSVGWAFNDADIKDLIESGEHPAPGFLEYLRYYAVQGGPQVKLMLKHAKGLAEMGTGPLLTVKEAHALRGRLLVIHGDKDDFFFLPSMEKLVREIPGTQLYLFPGAGHLDPFREPFATTTWPLIDTYVEKGTIGASTPIPVTAGAGEPHPAQ
jgi:pimeloyl-ACP methyl ester carboxylesterase